MISSTATIIAGLVAIAAALLKWYLAKDKTYEALQVGRLDVAIGDTDAVMRRVDRVLSLPGKNGAGDSPTGEPDDQDIARRLKNITGV